MAFILGGVVALVLALIGAVFGFQQMGRLKTLEEAKPATAQQLINGHNKGGFLMQCSIRGTVECDDPLIAPVSEKPCALYRHVIVRQREEEYTVRDDDDSGWGSDTRTETRTVEDRMPDEIKSTLFWVNDGTGRVLVDPRQAQLELEKETERFEYSSGMKIAGNRTLGLRYSEYLVAVGREVFVVGCATDREGRLMIAPHPSDRRQKFLLSSHSSEHLLKNATLLATTALVGAVVLGFAGVILLLIGLQ